MNSSSQYNNYIKPRWAPSAAVFAPIWTALYTLIFLTLGAVSVKTARGEWPVYVLVPFVLNLLFNILYTPLQFGAKNFTLAKIDIVIVLGTAIWSMAAIYKYSRIIFYAQIPHLIWLLYATVLQFSIYK